MSDFTAFGAWLRQHRKALDLTQEDLADHIGCSPETIRKIEAGKRRPSKQLVELVADRLGVPSEEQPALVQFARVGSLVDRVSLLPHIDEHVEGVHGPALATRPSTNLPTSLTSFIGRQKEIEAVRSLLWRTEVRLLTLTGAGGSGKTRLAIQAAAGLLQDFEDGVFFISLAPIKDPGLTASAVAQALGVRETPGRALSESLKDYLRDKQMLLVLDNFEHLLEAAPLVSSLLDEAHRLKVLATSREPLHLYGEHVFSVDPLALPELKHLPPLESLAEYDAICLFAQRARAVEPDFALIHGNAPAVAEVCHRLDGLPLAIELAAARIRHLSPQGMLARLGSSLKLLARGPRDLPARQQTLRATIDWSYRLLSEEEKRLFRRLSVFVGGCSLDAVEAVCDRGDAIEFDVLDDLASLVDKNLLRHQAQADGEPRFNMLETIREYARDKLEESGEAETIHKEHTRYFMTLADEAEPHLTGAKQVEWLNRLEDEHDNLRAALRWTGEHKDAYDANMGLRIAGALWRFWEVRGYLSEGREQLAGVLAQSGREEGAREQAQGEQEWERILAKEYLGARAKALNGAGSLANTQGDYIAARSFSEQSLAITRDLGDKSSIAHSLSILGLVAREQGDYTAARSLHEESLGIRQQLGDKRGIAISLHNLGIVAYDQRDYASARSLFEQGLGVMRELGDKMGIALLVNSLGGMMYEQRDYAAARSLLEEGLGISRELGDKYGIAWHLEGLAGVAGPQGDAERAAHVWGAAESLREAIGIPLPPKDRPRYERDVAAARVQLGEEAFAKAWAEGRAMSMDEAIACALAET